MKKSQKGFTIIEVALVLAIGALIFLVVFLAVPALQRNARNDARKRDISNLVNFVTEFSANNPTEQIPTSDNVIDPATGKGRADEGGLGKYVDTISKNISTVAVKNGDDLGVTTVKTDLNTKADWYSNDQKNPDKITVVLGAQCDGTTGVIKSSARAAAIVGGVEIASGMVPYCSSAN